MTRLSTKPVLLLLLIISIAAATVEPPQTAVGQSGPVVPRVFVWSNACVSANITVTNPSCGTLAVNSIFSVQVNVTNVPAAGAYNGVEFSLYFDPVFIKANSVDVSGTVFSSPFKANQELDNATGAVRLTIINLGACLTCANGTLVHINFKVTSIGVSPLALAAGVQKPSTHAQSLTRLVLGDVPIEVDTSDGYFRNEPTGDTALVYDSNSDAQYGFGEPVINGVTPSVGTTLTGDPKLKYLDASPEDSLRNATEIVFYDSDSDSLLDIGERVIAGNQAGTVKVDLKITYVDSVVNGVYDITRRGPIADFTFSPQNPMAGDSITFDATLSFDPDNTTSTGITEYLWDFGDGSTLSLQSPSITHIYGAGGGGGVKFTGNFSVRLTIVDYDSFESMKTARVDVEPIPFHDVAVESVTATPTSVKPGDTISIVVAVRDQGTFPETFNLTVRYGPPPITLEFRPGLQLASLATDRYTFSLDTSGLAPSVYEIEAIVNATGDQDLRNNVLKTEVIVSEEASSPFLYIVAGVVVAAALIVAVGLLLKRRRRPAGAQ